MYSTSLLFLIFVSYVLICGGSLISDTTNGLHYFVVFDTPILQAYRAGTPLASDSKGEIGFVWGASASLMPMYKQTNPNMRVSKYIPWSRDPVGSRGIDWWKASYPTWVVYKCDGVTPAQMGSDPHIVLDVSNPDVINWQIQNYAIPAMNSGYDYIAADNFAIINTHQGCGTKLADGTFVKRYNGGWEDPVYLSDALNWLKVFREQLHGLSTPMYLAINFVIEHYNIDSQTIVDLTNNIDLILDEAGFTNWADPALGLPDETAWLNVVAYQERLESLGKGYMGINQFNTLNTAAKNWAFASYLIAKGKSCGVMVTTVQGYGYDPRDTTFSALNVGSPSGARYKSQGVWMRMYSNGLAIVNANKASSVTITLPGDSTYVDVSGNRYTPGQSINFAASSGLVLVLTADSGTVAPTQASATAAPTQVPTAAPTEAPSTDAPTGAPTGAPTESPSAAPTGAPTEAPSAAPTEAPTEAPTKAPTQAPSQAPTEVPTQAPTEAPTQAPTGAPTSVPTDVPTGTPTLAPTEAPTGVPTDAPTQAPTGAPTSVPTAAPTEAPSQAPTGAPTYVPTAAPTLAPTQVPGRPTEAPTQSPTVAPDTPSKAAPATVTPTTTVTDAPTKVAPTKQAPVGDDTDVTSAPTSSAATESPSTTATTTPTARPTATPTKTPTGTNNTVITNDDPNYIIMSSSAHSTITITTTTMYITTIISLLLAIFVMN